MGHADDFIKSFMENHPHAKAGVLTMDELNKLMAQHLEKQNSMPQDDFDGISSKQMHMLLNFPLESGCILQYATSIDQYLDRVPLFNLSEQLLNLIKDAGNLKPAGKSV
jgi:hypothetical protein